MVGLPGIWYHKIISSICVFYLLTWALGENPLTGRIGGWEYDGGSVTWNCYYWLVVPTHLKNISQNGNLPQIGVEIKTIWNHHLELLGCILYCPWKKSHWLSLKLTIYIARENRPSPKRKGLLLNHHFLGAMWVLRSVSSWLCRSIYHELFCPSILTKLTTWGQNLHRFMIDGMVIKHESKHSNFDDHDT